MPKITCQEITQERRAERGAIHAGSLADRDSFRAAAFGDEPHRRLRDITLIVKRAAPSERRHVLVFMNATVLREWEALANRCSRVRVCAPIEEQSPRWTFV
jgi:hypothetical protein